MKPAPEACSGKAAFNDLFQVRWRTSTGQFNRDAFVATLKSLVLFPERTSTIILRADILEELEGSEHSTAFDSCLSSSWKLDRFVKRRLLPRNPRIDRDMLQNCFFFSSASEADLVESEEALIIYEPLDKLCIPFYHPQVSAIAFHYTPRDFEISIIPLPEHAIVDHEIDLPKRVDRTLLFLMSTIVKHSIGHMNNYEKRVQHDLVVQKSAWQDLYTELKGLYASEYLTNWVECTDPKKHVFEDLGIASFLINLWQQAVDTEREKVRFVDLGCGNGLLVDILVRQGWIGYGFDARHRKSWSIYGNTTQSLLKEQILFPTKLDEHFIEEYDDKEFTAIEKTSSSQQDVRLGCSETLHLGLFHADEFLIGNHARRIDAIYTFTCRTIICFEGRSQSPHHVSVD